MLIGELLILRKTLPPDLFGRLRTLDRWYGIVAGLVILTGLARLSFGLKGAAFYTHNPVFWTKMALFVAVGLISIAPTVAFIRWHKRVAPDGTLILEDAELRRIRSLLLLQLGLFVLIPLCAVFMARGL